MKLFLDTADTDAIKENFSTNLIDGITTNPTLIRKSGRDPEEVYQELIELGVPDIRLIRPTILIVLDSIKNEK